MLAINISLAVQTPLSQRLILPSQYLCFLLHGHEQREINGPLRHHGNLLQAGRAA